MPTDEPVDRIGREAGGYATRHRELHTDDPDFKDVSCPDCKSDDLEVISLFGGATSEVMFRCRCLQHQLQLDQMAWQTTPCPVGRRLTLPGFLT